MFLLAGTGKALLIDLGIRVHDGAQRIMAGAVDGQPEAFHGHEIAAYDLGFTTFLRDR